MNCNVSRVHAPFGTEEQPTRGVFAKHDDAEVPPKLSTSLKSNVLLAPDGTP